MEDVGDILHLEMEHSKRRDWTEDRQKQNKKNLKKMSRWPRKEIGTHGDIVPR